MLATLVETGDLLKTVIASVVAGVGVTAVFSVAIWGGARFVDLRLGGCPLAAAMAAALGLLALAITLVAVGFALFVMTSK